MNALNIQKYEVKGKKLKQASQFPVDFNSMKLIQQW
jgi:hypothetical protein